MKRLISVTMAAGVVLAAGACDVEQTEEAELPEVQGGQMPEYNVDTADVDVTTEERTVEVPVIEADEADASAE